MRDKNKLASALLNSIIYHHAIVPVSTYRTLMYNNRVAIQTLKISKVHQELIRTSIVYTCLFTPIVVGIKEYLSRASKNTTFTKAL